MEALSVLKDPSRNDIGSICRYIEVRASSLCPITSKLLLVLFDEHSCADGYGQNNQEVPSISEITELQVEATCCTK